VTAGIKSSTTEARVGVENVGKEEKYSLRGPLKPGTKFVPYPKSKEK
jgi:hypothetical protein